MAKTLQYCCWILATSARPKPHEALRAYETRQKGDKTSVAPGRIKMGRLEGKSVVITGAGSGIGRAASLMFTQEGAKLIAFDKTDAVDETVKMVRAAGGTAEALKGDAGLEQDVAAYV